MLCQKRSTSIITEAWLKTRRCSGHSSGTTKNKIELRPLTFVQNDDDRIEQASEKQNELPSSLDADVSRTEKETKQLLFVVVFIDGVVDIIGYYIISHY